MLLSRNEIRIIEDRKATVVDIPEWGAEAQVRCKMMSGEGRERYEQWAMVYSEARAMNPGNTPPQNLYARMAVLSCVDEQGDPLFTMDDVDWLSQKSFAALKRIFDVAWRLNLFDPEEVEKASLFFEPTPASDSGTDSPLPSDAP